MNPQDPRPSDAPDGAPLDHSPAPEPASPPAEDAPTPEVGSTPTEPAPAGPVAPAPEADVPSANDDDQRADPPTEPEAVAPTAGDAGPVTADPVASEPVVPEPAGSESVVTEPAGSEPVEPEPEPESEPERAAVPAVPAAVPPPPAAAPAPAGPAPSDEPDATSAPPAEDLPSAPRRRRLVSLLPVALLALGAVLLAVGTVFLALDLREARETEEARTEALAQARDAARVLFSYDHETLDEDFAEGLAVTTGKFREEYAKTTSEVVKDVAVEYKAVVDATVREAGVISASPDEVLALVFLNQATTSNRVEGQKIDQSRVRMRLVEEDGEWLVAEVRAL
jgi:Mce-associated membrane protein